LDLALAFPEFDQEWIPIYWRPELKSIHHRNQVDEIQNLAARAIAGWKNDAGEIPEDQENQLKERMVSTWVSLMENVALSRKAKRRNKMLSKLMKLKEIRLAKSKRAAQAFQRRVAI
jgi:hypothetical protein